MRALHLCFWLHRPYELQEESGWKKGYFGGEAGFREADKRDYQPLMALLERNAQRYANLRVSLVVSGVWLEQAERWDSELIRRLKKMVQNGNVELVATPYYYSMAAFYDVDELTSQVEKCQEKYEQIFGVKSCCLALPELCYNNRIARWAEKNGLQVVLAGVVPKDLEWRSPGRLYDAKGCEKVKIAFDDAKLSEAIMKASKLATVQVEAEVKVEQDDADIAPVKATTAADFVRSMTQEPQREERPEAKVVKKTQFSARRFQKQLDFALMRGDLVNLCLQPSLFGKWREMGVIGFFDEMFKIWLETPGCKMVGVNDIAEMTPTAEFSIKRTVSLHGESRKEYALPGSWTEQQEANEHKVYDLRKNILASKDQDLYVDFAKLTATEYADGGANFEAILGDIKKRLEKYVVKTKAGEEKIVHQGLTDSTSVKINFDNKAKETKQRHQELYQQLKAAAGLQKGEGQPLWDADDMDDMEAALQVMAQRMKRSRENNERDTEELAEAEVVSDEIDYDALGELDDEDLEMAEEILKEEAPEKPKSRTKKIFKKIIID